MNTETRVEFDHTIYGTPGQAAMCEWLRRHGIDPDEDVAVPGWIERRVDAWQVAWLGFELDETGWRRVTPTGVVRVEKYVQLDNPPEPFPEVPADGPVAPPECGLAASRRIQAEAKAREAK